jgi:hypothetical protein
MFIKVCIRYATMGTCDGQHLFVHIHMMVQQQQRATSHQTLKAYARMSSVHKKDGVFSTMVFNTVTLMFVKKNCYMLLSKQFYVGHDGAQQRTCRSWLSHRGQWPLVGWSNGERLICKLGVG